MGDNIAKHLREWLIKRIQRPTCVALSGHDAIELLQEAHDKFKEGYTAVVLVQYNQQEDSEDMHPMLRKLAEQSQLASNIDCMPECTS